MKVTALAGGIGASKFLLGLQCAMVPEDLSIVVNTGDDIELLGLRVCPDIDTVTYTLGGVVNKDTGWGISGDTFDCLSWLSHYTQRYWFNLGDRDLATHLYRTEQLRIGRSLTEITEHICRALGVKSKILPMTDAYTPTFVITDSGEMHFQEYFVRRQCKPRVRGLLFKNIESSAPAPGVERSLLEADLVIVCPSNPAISIGPILAVPGLRHALRETRATVVAITPIIGGRALKGPTIEMLCDLGYDATAIGVANLYRDIADIFVLDRQDQTLRREIESVGLEVVIADTVMNTLDEKQRLAREVLKASRRIDEGITNTSQGRW